MKIVNERRAHERVLLERPCKVYHAASRRYLAGVTCDVCGAGVLVRLTGGRTLSPGDGVRVLVEWTPGQVLRASAARAGRVARVMQGSPGQLLGIELPEAAAASRRAA